MKPQKNSRKSLRPKARYKVPTASETAELAGLWRKVGVAIGYAKRHKKLPPGLGMAEKKAIRHLTGVNLAWQKTLQDEQSANRRDLFMARYDGYIKAFSTIYKGMSKRSTPAKRSASDQDISEVIDHLRTFLQAHGLTLSERRAQDLRDPLAKNKGGRDSHRRTAAELLKEVFPNDISEINRSDAEERAKDWRKRKAEAQAKGGGRIVFGWDDFHILWAAELDKGILQKFARTKAENQYPVDLDKGDEWSDFSAIPVRRNK